MKVQVNFAVDYSADAFDKTLRLVVTFPFGDDRIDRRSGSDREGTLVDRLIASIELGNDEMTRCPERQHPRVIGIMVGSKTGKAGQ